MVQITPFLGVEWIKFKFNNFFTIMMLDVK